MKKIKMRSVLQKIIWRHRNELPIMIETDFWTVLTFNRPAMPLGNGKKYSWESFQFGIVSI